MGPEIALSSSDDLLLINEGPGPMGPGPPLFSPGQAGLKGRPDGHSVSRSVRWMRSGCSWVWAMGPGPGISPDDSAGHCEDRPAQDPLSYFERSWPMGPGPPRLAQGDTCEGGRARVPSLASVGCPKPLYLTERAWAIGPGPPQGYIPPGYTPVHPVHPGYTADSSCWPRILHARGAAAPRVDCTGDDALGSVRRNSLGERQIPSE